MANQPLVRPPPALAGSPTLLPNQHVKTIVELLRPAGPELARRWIAALLLVPPDERSEVVAAVEASIVKAYAPVAKSAPRGSASHPRTPPPSDAPSADQRDQEFIVVYPATQKAGYVEQIERTYGPAAAPPKAAPKPASQAPAKPRRATGRR